MACACCKRKGWMLEELPPASPTGNSPGEQNGLLYAHAYRGRVLQARHIASPPAHYLFVHNTWEETGSSQRLYNLVNVLGVALPAALQMSAREALCDTLSQSSSQPKGLRLTLRVVQQDDGIHSPVGQPLWRKPFPSAGLQRRQRAVLRFWWFSQKWHSWTTKVDILGVMYHVTFAMLLF